MPLASIRSVADDGVDPGYFAFSPCLSAIPMRIGITRYEEDWGDAGSFRRQINAELVV